MRFKNSQIVFSLLLMFSVVFCACSGGSADDPEPKPLSYTEKMLISCFSIVMPEAAVQTESAGDYYIVTIKTGKLDASELPEEEDAKAIAERLLMAYDDISVDGIDVVAQIVDAGDIILFSSRNGEMKYDYYREATENRPTISMEEYKRIYNGMKYAEVVEVIGGTGKTLSSIDIGDPQYKTEVIQWEGEGFAGSNATIEFQGGKVVGKAQIGLE